MVAILTWIKSFFDFSALVAKYFPPETAEEKAQDAEKRIHDEYEAGRKSGRPGA